MVNDFIVCIDRIIASTTCFGSVNEKHCDGVDPVIIPVSDNGGKVCSSSSSSSSSNKDDDVVVVVECRICQEEDQAQAMEAPCSCNGTLKVVLFIKFLSFSLSIPVPKITNYLYMLEIISIAVIESISIIHDHVILFHLMLTRVASLASVQEEEEEGWEFSEVFVIPCGYWSGVVVLSFDFKLAYELVCSLFLGMQFAHRKCIQRWCNKKGNTICEICNQAFSPNYSLPPVRSNAIMTNDIRQEWGHNADLRVALASAEQQLLQTEYEDYAMSQTSSIAFLRSVTLIMLMILLVREALMVTKNSVTGQDASIIFNFEVSLLQFAGVLLPCFAMARSWYAIQNRRRRQG
ncbi:hypothetical protein JHK82_019360 [Glycine max]|nr:hypothetical protein JHK82_019360 [Glycine max]KAH1243115.1 hypothetical protein GmHk_07G020272 [Glycine max]